MKTTSEMAIDEDFDQASSPVEESSRSLSQAAKSIFDVVVAFLAFIVLAPVFVVIALFVRLDGGPVFLWPRAHRAPGKKISVP